ncbi:class I SAM-dependent methyltransferase [Microbaculum marinum]|uniref:Methyltransferase domain-containing protein n=1 Tax=Microbaculum marinum TaxID=1764581 RepID=A0AAW9RRP5_9HYPH
MLRAVHTAAPGATILVAPEIIDIDTSLTVSVPLKLASSSQERPLLRFLTADTRLVIEAGASGGSVAGIDIAGRGHREGSLLEIEGVDDFTVTSTGIGRCEGLGFAMRESSNVRMEQVFVSDVGLGGGEIVHCRNVDLDIVMTMIGRRARADALTLAGVSGKVALAARDVSGNAINVRHSPEGAPSASAPLRLHVHAVECFRALGILGNSDTPLEAISADVVAEDVEDWAVLLNNCDGLEVAMQTRRSEPLRLDGRAGARNCTIAIATDRPDRIVTAGGSKENTISEVAMANWPPPPRAPSATSFKPRFSPHEVEDTCTVCGWHGVFRRTQDKIRETFACGACRASLRYRAQAQALLSVVEGGRYATLRALAAEGGLADKSVFEPGQAGPFRPYLRQAPVYKSSLFDPRMRSGDLVNGIECQDLTATSFGPETFDLVVTSDIMEHVRRPDAAWTELHRILKPGGYHVFSIPVTAKMAEKCVSRVDTSGDEDRLLMPAVYHGDGSGGLSLVYTDFGADLLDILDGYGLPTIAVPYATDDDMCGRVLSFVSRRRR